MPNKEKTFFEAFKENMELLGFRIPERPGLSEARAVEVIAPIIVAIEKFGTKVTLGELFAAGTKSEWIISYFGCRSAYWVGAFIGSLAVATGQTLSGGEDLADVMTYARRRGLFVPWLQETYLSHPQLLKKNCGIRKRDQLCLPLSEAK